MHCSSSKLFARVFDIVTVYLEHLGTIFIITDMLSEGLVDFAVDDILVVRHRDEANSSVKGDNLKGFAKLNKFQKSQTKLDRAHPTHPPIIFFETHH